nr:hypothetical protein Iba_chr06fCG1640 [Ipomoea batatas]
MDIDDLAAAGSAELLFTVRYSKVSLGVKALFVQKLETRLGLEYGSSGKGFVSSSETPRLYLAVARQSDQENQETGLGEQNEKRSKTLNSSLSSISCKALMPPQTQAMANNQ